jgi:hypothetical protein
MASRYYHTQRGTLMLAAMLFAAIVWAFVTMPLSGRWPVWAVAIGFLVLAWLFSSLTVEVNEHELRWYFGPGIWRYRIALDEIENVRTVRNHWWNGFGIRMGPGFRLYNVSGLDAVELRLKTGDIRRIGTDDPQGLATALRP